jgi:succinyl-CoA synthetase beta subunit
VKRDELEAAIRKLEARGFNSFLIEEFSKHEQKTERYLALQRVREGIKLWYHPEGGVDIEDATKESGVDEYMVNNEEEIKKVSEAISISFDTLKRLIDIFKKEYFAFLEINPLLINEDNIQLLDLAVEVDSAGDYFVTSWNKSDFVQKKVTIEEEQNVVKISEKSPSSFKLEVLNKNGSVWMLLSGGGASLVIADEYNNLGKGNLIGNYGEYSGAPNADETYEYAKQILSLLLKSEAKKKILLIAGGVANFTDVSVTFKGILRTLEEHIKELKAQDIAIFVRRGGPQQEKGLTMMRNFVEKQGLRGYVAGPELSLNEIVKKSLDVI